MFNYKQSFNEGKSDKFYFFLEIFYHIFIESSSFQRGWCGLKVDKNPVWLYDRGGHAVSSA